MRKKLSMMLICMLAACLMLSSVAMATEAGVSGNDVPAEETVEEEPVEEEPEEEEAVEEPKEEEPAEEEPVEEEPEEEEPVEEEPVEEEPEVEAPAGGEAAEPEEEVTTEEEPEKIVSGGGALAVDGYYDDWSGVPKTKITYGSHNSGGTIYEYHSGSILVNGDYVYVHIRMNDLYQQQIPVDELVLTINGIQKSFIIRKRNADNTINWSSEVYALSKGNHTDLGIFFRDGAYMALGEAAVTISDASPNDCFEFRMNISELEKLYGLEEGTIGNGAKLEFFSPNIGPERVTVVGSSTGTYIGILLCAAVVLCALIGQKRKQAHS